MYENHKHFQGWNPTTKMYSPGINNNNNNNRYNPNKAIGKKGCSGGIPTLSMFMIFINRKILNYYEETETKKCQGESCSRL